MAGLGRPLRLSLRSSATHLPPSRAAVRVRLGRLNVLAPSRLCSFVLLALWSLVACTPEPAEPSAPVRAVDPAIAKQTQGYNTRLIELKNQLQADAFSAVARLELGLLWLEMANPRSAEAELVRAVELGIDPNRVVPALVHTWNMLGRSKEVIEKHSATVLSQPEAGAELLAELAIAQASTGNPQAARDLVIKALKVFPTSAAAQLVQAKIELSDGKVDTALTLIESALKGTGRRLESLELKGDVLYLVRNDVAGGRAAYEDALKVGSRNVGVRAKLVLLALDRNELAIAQDELNLLERFAAGTPAVLYLQAKLAMAKGDLAAAEVHITTALADYPKDLRCLILGAEIQLKVGALRLAEDRLANALTLAPTAPRVRHLLAQTFMRSGAPEKAEMILEPLVRLKNADATALGLSAEAALQAGLMAKSMRLFERAAQVEPENARYRTAVAKNRITKGDVDGGFRELETVASAQPSIFAELALLSARLQRGDAVEALKVAERLANRQPEQALPQFILGRLKSRDVDESRKHFERALVIDPAFVPAALSLASLDLQRGATAEARTRLELILQGTPGSLDARMALIDIEKQSGAAAEKITEHLESAVKAHPGNTRPHLALINHLIETGPPRAALLVAQESVALFPNDLNLVDALARAQFSAGDSAQALTTFRRIVSARPTAYEPLLRLADVYAARGEYASAVDHYKQAVLHKPDLLAARVKMVGYQTVNKDWRAALQGAKAVQTRFPNAPAGYHLEGLVYAAQRQWEKSIPLYKAALALAPTAEVAIQLDNAFLQLNRPNDASRFAADWLKAHPTDFEFMGHRGEVAMATRDYAAAEALFNRVVKGDPKNGRSLNNLAWVLAVQGKKGAVDVARRAVALEPNNVNAMDTLAAALSVEGNDVEALALQKRAVQMGPKAHFLKLGLARLALKSKDFTLAREALDQLSALGKEFPAQAEVWQLRQQLY